MKRLMIICAVIMFSIEAGAQRTAEGSNMVSVSGGYAFPGYGVELQYGKYRADGFWMGNVSFANRHFNLVDATGSFLAKEDYAHLDFGADYLWRLFGSRARHFNVYGGGGAFLGVEFIDPFGKKPNEGNDPLNPTKFIFGLDARAEAEYFVADQFGIFFDARMPVNFSSQVKKLLVEVKLGVRLNF